MAPILAQVAVLVGLGVLWRWLAPGGLDADRVRVALSGLVYYLLLPALILSVLWQAPLGRESGQIAVSAAAGVLGALVLTWALLRMIPQTRPVEGTLLLAAGWPNATYLGLPILQASFGDWARRIAIQYDLFACFPLLMTLGILIARRYGAEDRLESPLRTLVRVPPLWAALAAVGLNLSGARPGPILASLLEAIGDSVPILMLLSVGMGLTWGAWSWGRLPLALLVAGVQLLVQPLLVLAVATGTGLVGEPRGAVVLEAAMPTMLLGLVLCDRYGLDTGLYAKTVTLTTAASLLTLPLWFHWLTV